MVPEKITDLMRRYNLRPDKRFGQNFLADETILIKVVEAAGVEASTHVLEIGAGLGSLTRVLARRAAQVVAVELDERLLPALNEVVRPFANVRVVAGDILQFAPHHLMGNAPYVVAANIPYNITSAILRHLLEAESERPQRLALMVQREVVERICAPPGDLSLLGLSVQVYGKPQMVARIPAGAFYPPPKVDSAVVRVDVYAQPRIPLAQLDVFFKLARAGFGQKRKTLRNALRSGSGLRAEQVDTLLDAAKIDGMRRAETLTLEEWRALTENFPTPSA